MSDEDEHQANTSSNNPKNSRRLVTIKSKLQELTREKARYNEDKLTQDEQFLKSEIRHLRQAIFAANEVINAQAQTIRTLNAEMTNFKSQVGLRYASLGIALKEKGNIEKELIKSDKTETYRNLAQQGIKSINEAIPQLQKLEEYKARLKTAEDLRENARKKRELLEESLKMKLLKRTETQQLLSESSTKLPHIENEIEQLRLERDQILCLTRRKKRQNQPQDLIQHKSTTQEQNLVEIEQRSYEEQLKKIRILENYFKEKMGEHQLIQDDLSNRTPTAELISPLYNPIPPLKTNDEVSLKTNEKDPSSHVSSNQPTIAIAMRLPRTFAPLQLNSTTTNEIIRSPHFADASIEYKKELPTDILDKYSGVTKKGKQQSDFNVTNIKKTKKNRKNFGIKHSQQIISLYNEVRTSIGNSDTLPSMPMFEYELFQTIQSLKLVEESIQSYLNEVSTRNRSFSSRDEIENESIRDSALDTFSETSSLIEPISLSKDLSEIDREIFLRPGQRSSSSSDDKKTIVSSSSSPPSHHSHSKVHISTGPLTTLEESSSLLLSQGQLNQIERQISDEGYRSVRDERQRSTTAYQAAPKFLQGETYDSTAKVDQWLSNSTSVPALSFANDCQMKDLSFNLINNSSEFQATNIDHGENAKTSS